MTCGIAFTPEAESMLAGIPDRRVREKIRDRIDGLAQDPDQQGKPLREELSGYRSVRAVGQRYRFFYRVRRRGVVVVVVALSIRKENSLGDVYAAAKRLIRLGLLDLTDR